MADHDAAMLTFVKLAGVSQSRQQLGPRDKFLVLAAVAACHAGHAAVAARCRELVVANNPAHILHRFESVDAALVDDDFRTFLKQLTRFCSRERGEHLLSQLSIATDLPKLATRLSAADYALLLLGHAHP